MSPLFNSYSVSVKPPLKNGVSHSSKRHHYAAGCCDDVATHNVSSKNCTLRETKNLEIEYSQLPKGSVREQRDFPAERTNHGSTEAIHGTLSCP
jgi:hypothetical protein